MVDALIFSKDRPAQLDLLLQSIERYAPTLYDPVIVLWSDSGPGFAAGYDRLSRDRARFTSDWRGEAFETKVRAWCAEAGETISFLVDDDVFYRSAPTVRPPYPISLRPGDFDYPWALDGCIYDKQQILVRLPARFDNPTQLEAGMAEWTTGQPSKFRAAYPCVVGIPANRVSESSNMPFTGGEENDPAVMNERFLRGERIDLDATLAPVLAEALVWTGTHQEIPYVWR